MKTPPVLRLAVLLSLPSLMALDRAAAASPSEACRTSNLPLETQRQVKGAIFARLSTIGVGKDQARQTSGTVEIFAASADVGGGGVPHRIIAYVSAAPLCGSGGCIAFTLTRHSAKYAVTGQIQPARLPIVSLNGSSEGWSNLGMMVAGGGIRDVHMAILVHRDGKYPSNPTLASVKTRQSTGRETPLIARGTCHI